MGYRHNTSKHIGFLSRSSKQVGLLRSQKNRVFF